MENHSKADTRKGGAPKEKRAALAESEEESEPLSPINIGSEAPLPSEFEFPDALELRKIESDTQNRLKAILEVAGVTGLSQIDARTFQDPEILRKLTNSVSSALDEAATALTRMKSDRQTYEAFLRGANQAPSPSPLHPSAGGAAIAPHGQQQQHQHHHPASASAGGPPQQANNSGEKMTGNVTLKRSQHQPLPQQQQQGGVSHPSQSSHQGTGGHQEHGGRGQSHHHHAHHHAPQQQQQQQQGQGASPAVSTTPPTNPNDSMQTVQRLLTQGHSIQEASEDGESLLSLACSAGYYELAEVLLRMRASVEDRGIKGDSTPLMEAASGGYADIVKLLIDHGANVNAKSSVGNTALTYACCGGYEDVVKILLDAGADVEHQNENGHTPLMEAASCGHVGVAKLLLQYGANINTHSNEFKESALTLACYKGHLEMVKFLLSAGADQEHKTDEMHTALMEASMDGHVDVARLLLDHGAQVNMPVDSFESPLTLAACGGHYELAALLISRGADLEEVNDEGYTPLMEAAREGHEDVVQLLVEHGANVNAQTEETQETALTLACCGGFMEVVQYLIEHGADIELGASTPLMEASQEGHVNIVKFLLERGAKVHAETSTGDTALTYACANGHTLIASILLQCGAELEHESEGGRTPLMKAARAGHLQTIQFLVTKGADVNRSTTNNDHTVLSLASAGGHVSVVQYLLIRGAEPSYCLRDGSTMLIEAARGGHTSVVNLLLRQPLMKRRQQLEQASAMAADSRKLAAMSAAVSGARNKHASSSSTSATPSNTATPSAVDSSTNTSGGTAQANATTATTTSAASGGGGGNQTSGTGKTLSSTTTTTLQHISPPPPSSEELSQQQQQVQDATSGGAPVVMVPATTTTSSAGSGDQQQPQKAGLSVSTGSSGGGGGGGGGGGSAPLQHPAKSKLAQKSGGKQQTQQQQQGNNGGREAGAYPQQQQQLPSDSGGGGTDKGSLSSRKGASGGGSDLIGAKRPKMSSTTEPCPSSSSLLAGMTPQQQQHISTLLATPTKMKMVDSDLPYVVTPPSTSAAASPGGVVSSAFSPGHYTTDSATALKNMQRLTSNANSPLKSGVMATSEVGTIVDVPPLLHSPQTHVVNSTHVNNNEVTLPSTQLTPDDIIQGHMTADDIVARYWQQQNISELSSSKHVVGESKANGARDEENAAQRMFSSGNFSTLPPHPVSSGQAAGYHHPSRFHASSSAMGIPPGAIVEGEVGGGDPQSLLVNSLSTGEHSNNSVDSDAGTGITQAPSVDSHPLSNVDLTRLIPHLEALAGSLQNQSPLETHQYLAALAAQSSHLLHPPPVSTEDGNIDVPPDIGADENDVSLPPLDPAALFSAAEIAKLLPNLASLGADSQSDGAADFRTVATGAPSAVSVATTTTTTATGLPYPSKYRPSMSTVRYMSRKFAGIAEMAGLTSADVGAGPDPGGGGVAMGVVGAGSEEEGSELDVDLLHQDPTRSLPPSLLLDNKFPLDIPPPSDLVPPENLLPTGYDGSLENESYPTSDEEEEPDEDESDSSYLAPHMSNLMPGFEPAIDIDQQTDSNHDTALTLAAAGGHDELVELLLNHGANIEHRDKKGCTPLILAASAGHAVTVAILLDHNADIEAQSDRTKDTALSLACSGGRQEVVELLLAKGANFEHRNVSDYTPLSLAASGGYVNIIKLLLRAGADINSRTGSKLGISPLMLAAMNGHTSTVKLLLDMGSDINAQIETNRNTALTLACFQGRHEVVNLLVERQANVEHRAKTGLTPLMEAASGGYYEVGKVLINKGADVNAAPVPSSKDTALTIAADKGHYKFVELILRHGANVDVKNKKGNSPLWLAANGGHLDVIRLLIEHNADVDSQDNRKVSCLMAAFRRGHFKVVKFLVDHVSQFPSDSELTRYIGTLSDKELLKKTQRCMEVIIDAKERQAAEANKNATILLQEIDLEKKHEEDRRAAAARKREKKKRKKEKKKAQKEAESEKGNGATGGDTPPEYEAEGNGGGGGEPSQVAAGGADEGDDDVIETTEPVPKIPEPPDRTETTKSNKKQDHQQNTRRHEQNRANKATELRDENQPPPNNRASSLSSENQVKNATKDGEKPQGEGPGTRPIKKTRSRAGSERSSSGNIASSKGGSGSQLDSAVPSSSPRKGKREEGWKEVGRRTKKVSIPGILFPQIVGKNSCNLAAIRQATSTQIDIDRHGKQSSNRTITVRGSADAIKQVHHLISVLIQDPNQDIHQLLTKFAGASSSSSSSAAASSSSAHRRHVTSSSHDPTPSVPPLETFEVASDAQPAKANPTATSASAAAAPTSTTVGMVLRSNYRKSGSVSSISTISSSLPPSSSSVGGKPSASLTQSLGGSFNVRVSAQGLATVSGDNKSHHHHQGTSSLLDSHHHVGGGGGDPSIHSVAAPPISTRVPTSGTISVNVKQSSHQHSQQQAIGSGPVRRLFTSGPSSHQPPAQLISTPAAASSSASVANPTRSTTTTATSGAAVSLVRTASGHTIPTGKVSVAPPAPGSGRAHPASQASKLSSSRPHEVSAGTSKQSVTYPVLLPGSEKQQQLSAPPPSHVVKSQVTIGGPPTAASGAAVSMSYSRVINAAAISAVQDSSTQSQAQQSQSQQQQMLGGEVIEQPLQQIMKTPMIFQDPAAQIAKAKKKSTYSDAVGKKSGVSSVVGANVAISGAPSGMVGMATVVPSSAVAVSSSGTAGVLQTAPPVSSQQIMTSAQQHKINLAPGSRPTTEMNPQLSGVGVGVMDKQRSRAAPWSEVTAGGGGGTVPSGSDKVHHPAAVAAAPTATGVYEDVEHEGGVASSERGAHLPHLGPIGPPSKSIKTGQSGFISGPSSAGKQSSSSSGRSFSPASSRPKTSPTALNTSPHRNEHSPAAKSPLLGTAPPGLLPPPDKGGGVYSTAFRPIQQHPEGDSSSNIPTLVPTPLRNSRPPLLETPPGFRIMSQGIRQQKPSSPVPSPEKSSPNKSPPVQAIKGFNPNAPTFVPMALQNQRPTNPPTSSILGAPPTPKFPVFGPSGGASILGSAPQLPPGPSSMYSGGGNQQPRMMSPAPPFSNQPGPPPPPPPQMVQTAAFIQQQPPPPPPPQGGQHQVAPPPPGPPQPPQQQQPPLTQSSLLGQPPSAPMSHPVFGGSGGGPPPPPPAFQTIQTRPPGPPHPAAGQGGMPPHPPQTPLYGHQIEGAPPPLPPPPPGGVGGASGPPSAGLIQQQPPQGPTPFGINLVPFASGVDPPPIGTSGAQPHPGQPNSATGDVPKFGLQNLMYFKPNADGAVPSDSTQQSMMFATAGGSAVGPHFETVGGPPLPATPSGIISSRTPGPENLFNHLNLGQLGAMGGAETVPDESNQSPSFQSAGAGNGFPQYPSYLHQQQPNQEIPTPSSSLTSVGGGVGGGGVIFTPSSNFIVMTPGVFTTATAGFTSTSGQPLTSQTGGGGATEVGDGLLPIGTERAHKSSTLPAAFSMLAPGNVWSYSGNPSSEGSDWAKVGSEASDWPSAVPLPPSSAGTTSEPAAGHKLESVLEKLGFSEYLPLFQKNEIDLDALQLMSEKEFTEIGLPTSPTHKLLSALQQSSPQTSTSATAEEPSLDPPPPGGVARNNTSGSSTPPSEAAPVVSTPNKQHAASQ